jgi:uncharacterized protein (TIGR02145 family)
MIHRIIKYAFFILPSFSTAQAPEKINFQSVVRKQDGALWSQATVALKIRILEGGVQGTVSYEENQIKTTDPFGLISLQIGTGTVITGVFKNIKWGDNPHYIQILADFEGNHHFTLLGTQELLSVPYSLFANIADTVLHIKPELDPLFHVSVAKGISQADTAYWNRKTGNQIGDMQVWNGSQWINIPVGLPGNQLIVSPAGIPHWQDLENTVLPSVALLNLSRVLPFSLDYQADISCDGGSPVTSKGIVYSTNSLPTLSDITIPRGPEAGSFTGTISGLLPNTTYYLRAFANNEAGTRYSNQISELTPPIATDVDGNLYQGLKIGNQTWLNKNLNVSKYQNNESIQQITAAGVWGGLTEGAWAFPDNAPENESVYGKLYNWFAVTDIRKICPQGWKVPSDEDWNILTDFLGGLDVAGGKLKSTGISLWQIPNNWASNLSNFSGFPAGYRDETGQFLGLGYYGLWWTSSGENGQALSRFLYNEFNYVSKDAADKKQGMAIRCILE